MAGLVCQYCNIALSKEEIEATLEAEGAESVEELLAGQPDYEIMCDACAEGVL